MPSLKIFTNLQRNGIPKDFATKILPVLSKSINKPEEKFMVTVTSDVIQVINMDASLPSIVASIESIGHIGPEENKIAASTITDFMEKELGVNKDRIFLTFIDLEASNVAKGGTTLG